MSNNTKIKIINNNLGVETFYCKLCSYPLATKDDFFINKTYFCCNECFLTFVESRKKEWLEGWRPKQSLIDSYINKRKEIYQILGEYNEF